ncbi:hypothetical protein [Lysobacter gummosus]|uniref:hypothetical protein n=1 Tax=Lysobacter gummosus TaxID=262324 RepID=UPI0036434BB3
MFPRRRAPLYFGGAEHPETSAPSLQTVIPAKAGIQSLQRHPPVRHSRVGGNPEPSALSFQNVIPANAGIQSLQRHPTSPSFPRRRESSDFKRSRTKGPGCSAPPK